MPRLFWYWIQFNTKLSNVDIQTDPKIIWLVYETLELNAVTYVKILSKAEYPLRSSRC